MASRSQLMRPHSIRPRRQGGGGQRYLSDIENHAERYR